VTDGRPLRFDATGVSAKLHRLRGNREKVAARQNQYAQLLEGLPASDTGGQRVLLQAKHAALAAEQQRICDRIRNLNRALAWTAARWAVEQAQALGASVVYLEDLATLEARGRRKGNSRLSGQVRGRVVDAIRHLAARAGLVVVTVPARGTSRRCPRCNGLLAHTPAPDRTEEKGWKWAVCREERMAGTATTDLLRAGRRAGPHYHRSNAACLTGARFPPPPPARPRASVRRDRCPRPTLVHGSGQARHTIAYLTPAT
jgi:hypothetical protein